MMLNSNVLINLLFFFIALAATSVLRAEPAEGDLEQKLQKVQSAIAKSKALVASEKNQETQQANQLQKFEQAFKQAEEELYNFEKELTLREQNLKLLEQREQGLNVEVEKQQVRLTSQLKNLFLLQKNNPFKVIVNFKAPQSIERVFQYHRYLKRDYLEKLKMATLELQQLSDVKNKLIKERSELHALNTTKKQQQLTLAELKINAAKRLEDTQKNLSKEQQKLVKMQREEQSLIEDLKVIQSALVTPPLKVPGSVLSFGRLKGRLHWPLGADIDPKKALNSSTSSPNPIIIPSKSGQNVYAIHHGRVVFSEKLQRFGLLIIIDHGSGYMSLYGHNQKLYKKVGDTVETNEMIASIGSTEEGSEERNSSLYFEIRKNGKPVNLVGWFK